MLSAQAQADPQAGPEPELLRGEMSLWSRVAGNTALRYGLALAASLIAILAARGLQHLHSEHGPFFILFLAIAFAALYCGIGPSVVAALICLASARYWLMSPVHSFGPGSIPILVSSITFLSASAILIALGEAHRRENQSLRNAHGQLDEEIKKRTVELHSANSNLRQLTARLLQLQDEERRRFARELHDSVGQMLAALSMNLATVRSDIDRIIKSARTLTDSEGLVQEMSKEIRTISHLLHPPLLDEAGLLSALRWYTDGFSQRSDIEVKLDIPEDFGRLPRELETAVFRIVQECLTNVHRHSGSQTAGIRVSRSDREVCVEVRDAGKGIAKEKQEELAATGTPGVGIRGMRERLRQLGGSLEIVSNHRGTLVTVRLPVSNVSFAAA